MRGHEHYAEAERLLGIVEDGHAADTMLATPDLLTAALAHATLAAAAATAAAQATAYDGDEEHARSRGWAGVA